MYLKVDPKPTQPASVIWRPHDQRIESWITTKRFSHNWFEHTREGARVVLHHEGGDGYHELESTIAESEWILAVKENFDGEGSPSYSTTTLQRAIDFLRLQWNEYWHLYGEPMPLPHIQPGPSGTIDVFWETHDFELLVNIPTDPTKTTEFSGDNRGKGKIEGTLDPTQTNRGLVSWLAPQ